MNRDYVYVPRIYGPGSTACINGRQMLIAYESENALGVHNHLNQIGREELRAYAENAGFAGFVIACLTDAEEQQAA